MVNAENQSENNKEIRDTSVLTDFLVFNIQSFPIFSGRGWTKDFLKQVRGIEPPSLAWEASVLPMNYTCMNPV